MRDESLSRPTARDWLRYAKGNLARARQEKPEETPWAYMCFDAEQAVEKAVKAVLVLLDIEFPRTHEIGELLVLAKEAGTHVPEELWRAAELAGYATHARYPGGEQPATEDDYREAVRIAESIVGWAETIVHGR